MKLTRLLTEHHKYASHGLRENFGDGYLMVHNRVFRLMREVALKGATTFSNERDEAYETFPLLQLDSVLQTKQIPYANNLSAFQLLSPAQLDALTWADLDGNLKKNFVFHEACHAVMRELTTQILGETKPGASLADQRKFLLRQLIEESCANTTELLGGLEAHDALHRIFFEMNSYIIEFDHRTNLKNAMQDIGQKTVISFLLLAYLHANFLRPIDDRQFKAMIALVTAKTLTPPQLKTLRALAKVAFNLNEHFRTQTTSFHLRLAGIQTPTAELFDFDFLREIEQQVGFKKILNEFAHLFSVV